MHKHFLVLALVAVPAAAWAAGADGVWKTQANDAGGYLEITIGPCADAAKTCGVVTKAFKAPKKPAGPNRSGMGLPDSDK